MTINWEELTSIATAIYGSAFLISLLFLVILFSDSASTSDG
jgi:hypothetical protein